MRTSPVLIIKWPNWSSTSSLNGSCVYLRSLAWDSFGPFGKLWCVFAPLFQFGFCVFGQTPWKNSQTASKCYPNSSQSISKPSQNTIPTSSETTSKLLQTASQKAFMLVPKGVLQGVVFQSNYFLPLVPCQWEKLIILNDSCLLFWCMNYDTFVLLVITLRTKGWNMYYKVLGSEMSATLATIPEGGPVEVLLLSCFVFVQKL